MLHRILFFARIVAMAIGMAAIGASTAAAQDAQIALHVGKAGFIIGGSGGNGTLTYKGKQYPLKVGGISVGLTIGAATADMVGDVYGLRNLSDINGIYSAASASLAAGGGAADMVLRNANGVELYLRGKQMGVEANLSANGMRISLQ